MFSLEEKRGDSNCELKQVFHVQKLGQPFPMSCWEPRGALQGRLGGSRACRGSRRDVWAGYGRRAQQKQQQKSLVRLSGEREEFAFHQRRCYSS